MERKRAQAYTHASNHGSGQACVWLQAPRLVPLNPVIWLSGADRPWMCLVASIGGFWPAPVAEVGGVLSLGSAQGTGCNQAALCLHVCFLGPISRGFLFCLVADAVFLMRRAHRITGTARPTTFDGCRNSNRACVYLCTPMSLSCV